MSSYNTSDDPTAYFLSLNAFEKAALYRALEGDKTHLLEAMRDNTWPPPYYEFSPEFSDFLAALPSGEAGLALNNLDWYDQMELINVDLTGWDTTGKDIYGANFSGSNVTAQQLNAARTLDGSSLAGLQNLEDLETIGKEFLYVNFTGSNISIAQLNQADSIQGINISGFQNLETLETEGKYLYGINLVGTNISADQLNSASSINGANLSGLQTLQGLNTVGKDLHGINFANSNITTDQLNSASSLMGTSLSGLDLSGLDMSRNMSGVDFRNTNITGEQLSNVISSFTGANLSGLQTLQNFNTEGKAIHHSNFANSNISIPQLVNAGYIVHIDLRGTGITKAALEEALILAGKFGTNGFDLNTIRFQ